ncbi:UDP-3-O-[3-hydroxymyristoyl] N-acetylglucosamine deacetylase [Leptospira perolatii]|uniref:UDP-3-O-acyl-N-acetylglucosamine deacetylase n=1 Tax=Leptospira perolatii TaxID=2023191 RepID=A0A2M9ZN99_9LEPT|nr:UDP-3-O-acyl-N-acetylglucosamine deacetylase [Leptospira perolatii]PJZ70194.1 UDP-3-O-[3-hydroxymyristoyl] N-acetylglucosamine deacetylase [Leptospira perolatii]PJZ73413.1 UDP-3-O-[3-hydroxymyristoyl] N-acetylglucosamine deacetylase [Leptospira perolatii]
MNLREHRKTIKDSIRIKGIGLHSGKEVNLIAHPAPSGTGIVFEYRKGNDKASLPVELSNVVDTSNATTLGDGLHKIQTVEHIMAAIFSLGITDMILEIDAVEIPIMDGSSLPFLDAFESIGYTEFEETIDPIFVQNPLWVVDGDKYLVILPSKEWKVTYTIDFPHPLLKGQSITIDLNREVLKKEILPARTFGFLRDVEALQARGLAMGGSLDNAIVLTQDGYLNESLRYENECVRHKILDLVGDLSIAGRPIIGHYLASKAGHALDISMAKLVMSSVTGNELGKYKSRRIPLFSRKAAGV